MIEIIPDDTKTTYHDICLISDTRTQIAPRLGVVTATVEWCRNDKWLVKIDGIFCNKEEAEDYIHQHAQYLKYLPDCRYKTIAVWIHESGENRRLKGGELRTMWDNKTKRGKHWDAPEDWWGQFDIDYCYFHGMEDLEELYDELERDKKMEEEAMRGVEMLDPFTETPNPVRGGVSESIERGGVS